MAQNLSRKQWFERSVHRKRIDELESEVLDKLELLDRLLAERQSDRETIQNLRNEIHHLTDLGHLLNSVEPEARALLFRADAGPANLAQQFRDHASCTGYVMSVDIRRSTEMLATATQPDRFAEFVMMLCLRLREIVWECHGVFDKFTGDGILASFPEFYSGPDAGYAAVLAAERCHQAFAEEFGNFDHCFRSVQSDAGLGIGIDFGEIRLVPMLGNLTAIGTPAVYACRLSGAPSGTTYLNRRAYEAFQRKYAAYADVAENEIEVKHQGKMLAYSVRLNDKEYEPLGLPAWLMASRGDASSETLSD